MSIESIRRWFLPGRSLVLALILLLCFATNTVWAQDEGRVLTLAEYQTLVGQAIDRLDQANVGGQAQRLIEVRRQFSEITGVELPTGEVVEVQPLLANAYTADIALARLRLVQNQLALSASDNTEARLAQLDRVFERPEFGSVSLAERFRRWIQNLIRGVLPKQPPESSLSTVAESAADLITWIIGVVGALILVFLLSFWLQGLLGHFVADAELRRRGASGDTPPLTAAQAQQQAAALAQAGDYRQAVRQLYLATLLRLEDRGLIKRDRSLTNREVFKQVATSADMRQRFKPVVDTFDRVWYGVREPDAVTYLGYERDIESLNQAISEPGDHADSEPGGDRP